MFSAALILSSCSTDTNDRIDSTDNGASSGADVATGDGVADGTCSISFDGDGEILTTIEFRSTAEIGQDVPAHYNLVDSSGTTVSEVRFIELFVRPNEHVIATHAPLVALNDPQSVKSCELVDFGGGDFLPRTRDFDFSDWTCDNLALREGTAPFEVDADVLAVNTLDKADSFLWVAALMRDGTRVGSGSGFQLDDIDAGGQTIRPFSGLSRLETLDGVTCEVVWAAPQ